MEKGFICVSDESVNQYRFRVISGGGDFTRFKKNPIMLYVHERSVNGKAKFPIGRWEDLQVTSDGRIIARPVFNEKNPDGLAAKESYEGGFLNAASINLDPIEWNEDPEQMLPGQMYPTVTKWELLEISLVDIPGNGNAVRLSHHGISLKLSSDGEDNSDQLNKLFYPPKNVSSMKSIIAVLTSLNLGLSLSEDSKESEVLTALNKALALKNDALSAKDALITQLTTERDGLKLAKEQAEQKAKDDKATALVDGAQQAKKITAEQREHYLKLAKADYDTTKTLLEGMQGYQSVRNQLTHDGGTQLDKAGKIKKFDELFKGKNGELLALKESNWDEYADLYKAKYGREPRK